MILRSILAFLICLAPLCPAAREDDRLHSFISGSMREILRAHTGKPAILHFWGMTCGPCLIELPSWGKLASERPDLNLVLIHAESLPRPDLVMEVITRSGLLAAENWAFGDASSERLRFEVDPAWQGELPMTIFITADGMRKTHVGTLEMAEVAAWLDRLKTQSGSTSNQPASDTRIQFLNTSGVPDAVPTL